MINYLASGSDTYESPASKRGLAASAAPSVHFYLHLFRIIKQGSVIARKGMYGREDFYMSATRIMRALEDVGVRYYADGLNNMAAVGGACVIVGNHMSTMETMTLPAFVLPFTDMTFVLKQSLLEYPVFGTLLKGIDPIAVTRTNPREDLKAVLEQGTANLEKGKSIVIFPQTTRSVAFNPSEFNSIGIKLARRAGVPVVPVALKTDAWQQGSIIKDIGRIRPGIPVHYSFGQAMKIEGRGDEEHQRCIEFIESRLKLWGQPSK